jgi:RNase adaptor protein for sRNA GlmZ degradation
MAGYNIVVSAEDTVDLLPSVADLRVYPNPFHQNMDASRSAQGLTVEYYVPADSRVIDVSVFNIKGQLVESLISESAVNGKHSIVWSFGQNGQSKVNSGVYFIRLQTDKEIITKRAMILK